MRWFDLRHLKSVSLMVGAGALAVVLAMNSEAHAKRRSHQHHPGEPSHRISDDHNERSKKHNERHGTRHGRSKKHNERHDDRHDRSKKHHQSSSDLAALSLKLDEVLLAINALPPGTALTAKLDEVLLAINALPIGTALPEKLDEVLLALNALPTGGALPCGAATAGIRFVVSTDGTEVCDNTTGLIWEQMPDSVLRQWQDAIKFCPTLGTGYRLPEVKELISLVDFGQSDPALPADHPFSNVLSIYWSATPAAGFPLDACSVVCSNGARNQSFKTNPHNVWCVRDGP